MHRILIVDDEPNILNALRRVLRTTINEGGEDFDLIVEAFEKPELALARARDIKFDAVLSDYRMPVMDGVTFLKAFRLLQPDAICMILSGQTDLSALINAINEVGLYRFIGKPWQDYELRSTIAQALDHQRLVLENQRLADTVRVQKGKLSRRELELRRLEAESPGITQVKWGPDGSIMLDDDEMDDL